MRMTASKVGWPNSLLGSNVLVWCKLSQFWQGHPSLPDNSDKVTLLSWNSRQGPASRGPPTTVTFLTWLRPCEKIYPYLLLQSSRKSAIYYISFINFRNISLQLWCLVRLSEVSRDQGAVFRPIAAFRCGGHNFLRTIWKESLSSSSFPFSQYHDFKPSSPLPDNGRAVCCLSEREVVWLVWEVATPRVNFAPTFVLAHCNTFVTVVGRIIFIKNSINLHFFHIFV